MFLYSRSETARLFNSRLNPNDNLKRDFNFYYVKSVFTFKNWTGNLTEKFLWENYAFLRVHVEWCISFGHLLIRTEFYIKNERNILTKSLEMECTAGNDVNNFLVGCVSTRSGGGEIISEAVLGTSSSAGSKHTDRLIFKGLVNILLFCKLQFWALTTKTLPIIPGPSCRSSGCFSLRWWRNIPIPVRKSFGWPTSIQKPEKVNLYTVLLYSKHLQYSGIQIFKPTTIQVIYMYIINKGNGNSENRR